MLKTYNKPQTLVAAIACNQGICQIVSSTDVNILTPETFGSGDDAH